MNIRVESESDIIPHLRSADAHDPYLRARRDPQSDRTAHVLTAMIGSTGGFNGPDAAFDLHNRHFMTRKRLLGPVARVLDDALVAYNHVRGQDNQPDIAYVALQPWTLRYDRRLEEARTDIFFTPSSQFMTPQYIAAQGLWLLLSGQVDQKQSDDLRSEATSRRNHADIDASRQRVHDALKATLKNK